MNLDPAREARAKAALEEHFRKSGYWNASEAADFTFGIQPARERLAWLAAQGLAPRGRGLVSGAAAGTELLALKEAGCESVAGLEVDPEYVTLARNRFEEVAGLEITLYDGLVAPFPDASFDTVYSSHVVEHTADPPGYVKELVRILAPGGALLMEFPTRYHVTELHTGLPSVEWLPRPLRNAVLGVVGSHPLPFLRETRRRARSILDTGLRQVSRGDIVRWARPAWVVAWARPSPGIVRLAFVKDAARVTEPGAPTTSP